MCVCVWACVGASMCECFFFFFVVCVCVWTVLSVSVYNLVNFIHIEAHACV